MKHSKRLKITEWTSGRGEPSEEGTSGQRCEHIKGDSLERDSILHYGNNEYWVWSVTMWPEQNEQVKGTGSDVKQPAHPTHPQDVHVLIPRTWENVTLRGERDSADVIKLRTL